MDFDPVWMVHAKLAFASLCGGIVRLLFRPAENLGKTIWLLFGCVTCGFYATPIIVNWLGVTGPEWVGALGAVIGLIGLSFANGVLSSADRFDLSSWLGRKIP